MTRRSVTAELTPTDVLEISPGDATELGVRTGDAVRVVSRYGETRLPVELNARVLPGQLFTTFSDPGAMVNRVTGPHMDPQTHTPEYKVTAVRIEPVGRT
jgi:formate dehydrogenase major subunit